MYVKTDPDGVSNPQQYTLGQLRRDNPSVQFDRVIPLNVLEEFNVYPVQDTPQPEFNAYVETPVQSFQLIDGTWTQVWTVTPLSPSHAAFNLIEKVADERYEKETAGIVWLSPTDGKLWYIATDLDSQGRIDSSVAAVDRGLRVDGSVWKTAEINPSTGGFTLAYRSTTNAEIQEWGDLVGTYVQKCFTAEANTVNKIMMGDFTADFETEFNAL